MSEIDAVSLIGKSFGDPDLSAWLAQLEIDGKPKLKRGDDTTYLSNVKRGIELTFRESASLGSRSRDYLEGALVLSNIRFYGVATDEFSVFNGTLPFSTAFGQVKSEILKTLGPQDWQNPAGSKLRWNRKSVWLLASLDERSRLEILSLQMPREGG